MSERRALRARRLLTTVSVLILLSACAQQGLLDNAYPEQYAQQRDRLLAQDHWQLRAKVGIKANGKGQSAMMNWQQRAEQYNIRLAGPFGAGAVKLSGNERSAKLEHAAGPPQTASSASDLLHQATGLRAPVDNLRFWLRGMPAESKVSQLMLDDSSGALLSFAQDGWQISYDRYRDFSGYRLPARITITALQTRAEQTLPDKLTVLVNRWSFDPAHTDRAQ